MVYSSFLTLMSQLVESSSCDIVIDERSVRIQKLKEKDVFVFSTKLISLNEEILSCFSSQGIFKFQQGNVSLKLDSSTGSIFAEQRVQMLERKYIPFKQHLTYFLAVVSEYEEILESVKLKI